MAGLKASPYQEHLIHLGHILAFKRFWFVIPITCITSVIIEASEGREASEFFVLLEECYVVNMEVEQCSACAQMLADHQQRDYKGRLASLRRSEVCGLWSQKCDGIMY
jgi:ribosomal protein S27AE